jgi:hypothetical protein
MIVYVPLDYDQLEATCVSIRRGLRSFGLDPQLPVGPQIEEYHMDPNPELNRIAPEVVDHLLDCEVVLHKLEAAASRARRAA